MSDIPPKHHQDPSKWPSKAAVEASYHQTLPTREEIACIIDPTAIRVTSPSGSRNIPNSEAIQHRAEVAFAKADAILALIKRSKNGT